MQLNLQFFKPRYCTQTIDQLHVLLVLSTIKPCRVSVVQEAEWGRRAGLEVFASAVVELYILFRPTNG